ncbi:hypothetical protein MNBD_GAMMA12-3301, partial [hydrothermal vent metagenome]
MSLKKTRKARINLPLEQKLEY